MRADREAVEHFLTHACGDAIQLTSIPADGGAIRCRWFGRDAVNAAGWAATQNARRCGIFWAVNRVRPGLNSKPSKADIVGIRYAHVDIDPPKDGSSFDKLSSVLDLELFDPTPSLIVDSGGGLQAFWRIDGDVSKDEAEGINRAIEVHFGGDHCHDVCRIMRVPGTVNYPNAKKRAAGRVPALAATVGMFASGYTAARLAEAFSPPAEGEEASAQTTLVVAPERTSSGIDMLGILPDSEMYCLLTDPRAGDRSRDTFAAACAMVRRGFDDAIIAGVLLDPNIPVSAHCLDQPDPERAAQRAIEKARVEVGAASWRHGRITATPYGWPDPRGIPQRRWLYGKQLMRGTLALIVAPGATGKTALTVGIALSLASGCPLLGHEICDGPQRVWLWNLEDSREELDRALGAARLHHDIDREDIVGNLFVDSGLDGAGLCTAVQNRQGFTVLQPIYDELLAEIEARGIDVLIVDPFVSSHSASENDNGAIDAVAKAWARIAAAADCAIVLVHHTTKAAGAEVTADRSRGASALVNAARSVVALNRMSSEEAKQLGVREADRRRYFRAYDDKNNRAPPAEGSDWYRLESVTLPNGEGEDCFGDDVVVVVSWTPPAASAEALAPEHVTALQKLIGDGEWREHQQAALWAGKAVAQVFGLDVEEPFDRARIKSLLKECLRMGWLGTEQRDDHARRPRIWIVPGQPIAQQSISPNEVVLQCSSAAPVNDGAHRSKVLRSSAAPYRGAGTGAERLAGGGTGQ